VGWYRKDLAVMNSDIVTSRHVYMTLEYPDGYVIHGKCLMASIEIEHPHESYAGFLGEVTVSTGP